MDSEKKPTKHIFIEISNEIHQDIKIRSAQRNISMKTWVIRALIKAIENEKKYE